MTCSCITFVGLIAITIMKRFSKNSVQPINISLISALQKDNIQAIHSSKSDERQNTCELQAVQSHSRIINVAPIHLEEQIFESLDNIDLPIECIELNSIGVENPGSEIAPEAPRQTLCLNNQKFNLNLISFPVLTFLFVVFLILVPIYLWHFRFANDFENHILKAHIFYCSTLVLPTVYFILNPEHLKKATILLFEGL